MQVGGFLMDVVNNIDFSSRFEVNPNISESARSSAQKCSIGVLQPELSSLF
jgi:hypothetical protein